MGGKGETATVKREDKVGLILENRAGQALICRLWTEGKKVVALVKQAIAQIKAGLINIIQFPTAQLFHIILLKIQAAIPKSSW